MNSYNLNISNYGYYLLSMWRVFLPPMFCLTLGPLVVVFKPNLNFCFDIFNILGKASSIFYKFEMYLIKNSFSFNMLCQKWKIIDKEELDSNLSFYLLDLWFIRVVFIVNWDSNRYPQAPFTSVRDLGILIVVFLKETW